MLSIIAVIPTQNANAHTPGLNVSTLAFLNVSPNPIGIGQGLTVNMWLAEAPPTANGAYGDRWQNMTVKVTLPDATTTTLGPFTSDASGGTAVIYTPKQIGNYSFVMNFPGQTLAGNNPAPGPSRSAAIGDYFMPATSNTVTVTVQEQAVSTIPFNFLPTEYWTRPINAMNTNWYSISGNWLGISGCYNSSTIYNPYSSSPKTSHILWTKPEAFGGTVGGEFGGSNVMGTLTSNYYSARQYETMFTPIIINGVLYYEQYPASTNNPSGWVAVNLKTGQTLWTNDASNYGGGSAQQTALTSAGIVTSLTCGQLLNYVSPNQFGGFAYLWSTGTPAGVVSTGTTYNLFDAMTGKYVLSIVNGSSFGMAGLTQDEQGDLIGYYIDNSNPKAPTLNCWNSTQCLINGTWAASAYGWMWRPTQNGRIAFNGGIMWSKPLPTTYDGNSITNLSAGMSPGFGINSINSGTIILSCAEFVSVYYQSGYVIEAGYSQTTGEQLWITNRTETPATKLSTYIAAVSMGNGPSLNSDGVFVEINMNTLTMNAYSDYTGKLVWGPVVLPDANTYDVYQISGYVANGTLYLFGMGGDIYAANIHTGEILWHTTTDALQGSAGYNTPYGVWPLWPLNAPNVIADGVFYLAEGHSYSPPTPRGLQLIGVNITNGELVWSMLGDFVTNHLALSDGVMVGANNYDNQIYAFGTGATKMTVNAPNIGVTTATPITITGTITDLSSGASQEAVAANYPNGLPCVSDASMSDFMEAIYEQQPMPTNITGVPITISVLDSNGNYRTIGTTTSEPATGTFALNWTPDISGSYTIYATFTGSESYYSSNAVAYIYTSEPPATASPQPTSAPSMSDLYFLPSVVGIIIAIIAVGLLTILMLKKKP